MKQPVDDFLDVILPDADGQALCRQIKADPAFKDIFVVLISGTRTESAEQADGLEMGADGYVARPITNRELLARVNTMVRILQAKRGGQFRRDLWFRLNVFPITIPPLRKRFKDIPLLAYHFISKQSNQIK